MTVLLSSPATEASAASIASPGTATKTMSAPDASPPSWPRLVISCPAFFQSSAGPPPMFPLPIVVIFI
ncbi:MAG TPA: hypothetical protein VIJ21_02190 [Solirubrobacterales bacterium]